MTDEQFILDKVSDGCGALVAIALLIEDDDIFNDINRRLCELVWDINRQLLPVPPGNRAEKVEEHMKQNLQLRRMYQATKGWRERNK